MGKTDNLTGRPFSKDDTRINRKGRPKRLPELDVLIVELLGEKGSESRMREMLASLIELAVGGNIRAAEVILNRAYGKVKDVVELTTNGGEAEEKNKLILGAAGDVCDRYGNFICTIPDNKMHLFKFDIHFVDSDGVQAFDYDGSGIVSDEKDYSM